ncbi:Thioredoxin-like [Oopsacas minuta]|uniref:Thioredoxin n=1 Tax=Oopsacas minuta TaxID=111878 RepID=A0AAV7K7I9_9METZ|nr:Thioredoxin-like [Oopsacas minuta]
MATELKTLADFSACIKVNAKVAVDFTATWCGPCQFIGPKFVASIPDYPNIKFVKVDVDANSETAQKYGVSAMPTFKFFHNQEQFDELVGADEAGLKKKLEALNAKA